MKARFRKLEDIIDAPLFRQAGDIIGIDALNELQLIFGGKRLFVPRHMGPHHPIAQAIGLDAARALAQELGGQRFDVPLMLKRRALIEKCLADGLGSQKTADRVGCTRRAVQYTKAQLAQLPAPKQPRLL